MLATLAPASQLTLSWNPNPEPDIAEYVVRWGEAGKSELGNSSVLIGAEITVEGLILNQDYWFTVEAVTTSGLVSAPSEILIAKIPAVRITLQESTDLTHWETIYCVEEKKANRKFYRVGVEVLN